MTTFLKRHYLNDAKLAQRALLELHRALNSGRLVAFTGSLTTQPCGYGTWDELIDAYGRLAQVAQDAHGCEDAHERMEAELEAIRQGKPVSATQVGHIAAFRAYVSLPPEQRAHIDPRVTLGLFEEPLAGPDRGTMPISRQWGHWELDQVREPLHLLSIAMARYFRKPYRKVATDSAQDVLGALLNGLGVRRVATLNYDFEVERRLMLADRQADGDSPFDQLRKLRAMGQQDLFDWHLSSGQIRRLMPNGQAIESDILNRERIDRMLEFAVGADDVDRHVLHLHGRACSAESMILSYRDYDRLYRRQGLSKLPFEFAQRILMGGNPVLFVGLGMSENELNATLQDFVSSSPYQRAAPTFLLWNTQEQDRGANTAFGEPASTVSGAQMRRLDRLHRLGVLTIFDTDLMPSGEIPPAGDLPARLASMINKLAERAACIGSREEYTGGPAWRHMMRSPAKGEPTIVWQVAGTSRQLGIEEGAVNQQAFERLTAWIKDHRSAPALGIIARQGCGKGSLAWRLAHDAQVIGVAPEDTILINASFSFDTDSVLDAVARFLDERTIGTYLEGGQGGVPKMSRNAFFRSLSTAHHRPILIIVNGCERFFSVRGEMLSAELHELFWRCATGKLPFVRLVLLGTSRTRSYIETLGPPVLEASEIGLEPSWSEELPPIQRFDIIRRAFCNHGVDPAKIAPGSKRRLDRAVLDARAMGAARISGDLAELRRAFFDLYLDPAVLGQPLGKQLGLATDVIRALAFIGLPAEAAVLVHVPRLRQPAPRSVSEVEAVLTVLEGLGLVLRIRGHQPRISGATETAARFTLPRLLMTEMRARFSVPLSEAKLSTAYNMSLYVAQPVDGYIPEPEIHDELGQMVDRLLGAYRDVALREPKLVHPDERETLVAISAELMPHEDRATVAHGVHRRDLARELETLASVANMQCFRAALALIRGYYTTTDLLTLDVGDRLIREDRDPILQEHAERLDRLIDAYGKIALARQRLRTQFGDKFGAKFGMVEPLYPDELVWLHNERGVIRLAMGDLYEARTSFLRALDINRLHVERTDRSHNWRRIRLNQLAVDIESGEIDLARRKADEILAVSEGAESIGSREDRLAIAVASGYRGWTHQLHGNERAARIDYDAAIASFEAAEEARATIYFERLRHTLSQAHDDGAGRNTQRSLNAVLTAALATRQMDLVYQLRVMRSTIILEANDSDRDSRKAARQVLEDAQTYALQTAVNRVRVEASMAFAGAQQASGDHEGALRSVSDAMMVATRYGMELRKIVLRSMMARIMAERGHPITATNLAETAIRMGSRLRYAIAIKHAEETLARVPKISALMQALDTSSLHPR
ncbi:tetratricopeptide (TPR) repeat protein [Novosphingobium chloroacetimidivorans]|uniref:Tetratricopeptide (TPR) repeat protein n=1 Tax=Novosphingobium chloroacetimidivorans TaxID=1428314 RepID=A0A7W7KCM2_9SPHN|nr:SIR2 family protein [Novosphingobium chloroacetimidivorans]MBB4859753.1 tetratricopeptide (TPR) repeat protein [Novosphingobium chloroacetimidivorans]